MIEPTKVRPFYAEAIKNLEELEAHVAAVRRVIEKEAREADLLMRMFTLWNGLNQQDRKRFCNVVGVGPSPASEFPLPTSHQAPPGPNS